MSIRFDSGRNGFGLIVLLLVAVAMTGCASLRRGVGLAPGKAEPKDRPAAEARMIRYIRTAASLPADAKVEVTGWNAATVPGWNIANVQIDSGGRSQQVKVTVSQDGRYLSRGELVDLTVDPAQAIRNKIDLKGQPVRGAPDASVTVVEYSDFQCPFCARAAHTVEHELLEAYPGKVKLVHKNFPLTQIHPWAESGAIAAECALAQQNDGYWKVYETLFEQQKAITPANLKDKVLEVAGQAGLDTQKLGDCYDTKATAAQVQADMAEASVLGVNSTPTFFVNGQRISGAQPIESFRALVDQALGSR